MEHRLIRNKLMGWSLGLRYPDECDHVRNFKKPIWVRKNMTVGRVGEICNGKAMGEVKVKNKNVRRLEGIKYEESRWNSSSSPA